MTSNSLPLISVLMPAYNHEKYVQSAIRSIIRQSYQNIELLVLDDGSSDSTREKIETLRSECSDRFVRVWYKTRENKGRCQTLNELLYEAKGEYIYMIASDDMAIPHAIEKLYVFLSANPDYLVAVGDNIFIDEHGRRIFWDAGWNAVAKGENAVYGTFGQALQANRPDVNFFSDEFGSYLSLLKGNYIPNGCLIRRQTLLDIGGYTDEAPLEDWYHNLQFAKRGKMQYIDKPLFLYRWHATNTAKLKEYMRDITAKTLYYEYTVVEKIKNPRISKIFYSHFTEKIRYEHDYRPFFAIKKVRNKFAEKKYLVFFKFSFLLKSKSRDYRKVLN